jgi:hypothetical protein
MAHQTESQSPDIGDLAEQVDAADAVSQVRSQQELSLYLGERSQRYVQEPNYE